MGPEAGIPIATDGRQGDAFGRQLQPKLRQYIGNGANGCIGRHDLPHARCLCCGNQTVRIERIGKLHAALKMRTHTGRCIG